MSIFGKITTFLKTRLTVIPRSVLSSARKLDISAPELDLICKLLNFNIKGEIYPQIDELAKKAGISSKTLQRASASLEKKGYLTKNQRRGEDGRKLSNTYHFSPLWKKIHDSNTSSTLEQMSLFNQADMDMSEAGIEENYKNTIYERFGEFARSLLINGFVFVPRNLDEFQKELSINTYEILFIKYLFGYIDETGNASISLNTMVKHLPISKSMSSNIISSLIEKGYICVQGQKRFGRKWKNNYDLNPLVKILEKLEKKKVKTKLINQDRWKTFRRCKKAVISEAPVQIPTPIIEKDTNQKKKEEIRRIEMEIAIRKSQNFSKDSDVADEIREYERQRSELIGNTKTTLSLADIIRSRFPAIQKTPQTSDEDRLIYEARRVCDKVGGNFNKDRNFYIKAVRTFPTTIDFYITRAVESAEKSSERYFSKMIAEKTREISNF